MFKCFVYIEFDEKEKWFKDASKIQQIYLLSSPFWKTQNKFWKVFQGLFPGKMFGCRSVLPTTVMVLRENFLKVRGRTQSFQIDKICCRVLILQKNEPSRKVHTSLCLFFVVAIWPITKIVCCQKSQSWQAGFWTIASEDVFFGWLNGAMVYQIVVDADLVAEKVCIAPMI